MSLNRVLGVSSNLVPSEKSVAHFLSMQKLSQTLLLKIVANMPGGRKYSSLSRGEVVSFSEILEIPAEFPKFGMNTLQRSGVNSLSNTSVD